MKITREHVQIEIDKLYTSKDANINPKINSDLGVAIINDLIKKLSLGCVSESYKRPKTVGELLDLLKEGIKCEVAANAEKITSIKLDGWLNFENKYKTKISKNKGWVIYEAV